MRYILAKEERVVLERFARSEVLVGLDFDGTLAPIVDDPRAAKMRAATVRSLRELAVRYPCAVLSGRARDDVAPRLSGVPLVEVIGNHGIEPSRNVAAFVVRARGWDAELRASLGATAGIVIENKGPSLAIHFRKARRHDDARRRIEEAVSALVDPHRVVPGKLVVNVLPEGAPHKGVALLRLRDRAGADTAIYVGDDVTDEDVFSLDDPGHLLSIRVGRSTRSAARFYLRSQREIDALLDELIELRNDASGGRLAASRGHPATGREGST